MTKRRPSPRQSKSACDEAIEKALHAAGAQVGAHSGGSIINRLSGKADASIAGEWVCAASVAFDIA